MLRQINAEKLKTNLSEAFRVIKSNKVRTFLTALGIIFGVAAVITMLAIGRGAQKEILDQLELVGANNIVIQGLPDLEKEGEDEEEEGENTSSEALQNKFSKGLDLIDLESIQAEFPTVESICPEIVMETFTLQKGRQKKTKLVGTNSMYFAMSNIDIERGNNFSSFQIRNALPVCIIGKSVEKKIFAGEDALNKYIKVKDVWLQVIGIIEEKIISSQAQSNLGIRNLNEDVYIPYTTFLSRFRDRSIQIDKPLDMGSGFIVFGGGQDNKRKPRGNYHQVDRLTIKVKNSDRLQETANLVGKYLQRSHNGVSDYEITIPVNLLKQQQKTKQIFNIVLSIIAGISLLIGGIGIMNIMLASVLERTKEIGIIRAIGATEEDVVFQFLSESIIISMGGGIIGILLGIIAAYLLTAFTGIQTILSLSSIIISFSVATSIGLIFGIAPARAAANKKPIEALRYE
jgi:putative ABC transport system permease protein